MPVSKRRLAAIVSLDVVGYSKMMQSNPKGLLGALNKVFNGVVKPEAAAARGRVVKLLGDGAILEFHSASDAVTFAASLQKRMHTEGRPDGFEHAILLRAGIHAGDILVENNDVFGDAVNIAARLQAAAEPGGVLLSGVVEKLAGKGLDVPLRREGNRRFKNIADPVETLSIDLSDEVRETVGERPAASLRIQFCKSADGQSLAWSAVGEGMPVVKAPNWIGHLELDWRSPSFAPLFRTLSRRMRFVCFDARGNGLSDWHMPSISFESMVDDLEAVFNAAGIDRAPIVAISQGCSIAAAFAVRAPERVSSIVMIGAYPTGRARRPAEKDRRRAEALRAMMSAGWDDDYPSLRDLMAETISPGASREDLRQYADDMRLMISPENLGRYREVVDNIDVTNLLSQVRAPCLVMHSKGDRMQPIEQGRKMAASIPDARFVQLDSNNHCIPENDPVWPVVERDILAFIEQTRMPA